jgi:uncharacterized protein
MRKSGKEMTRTDMMKAMRKLKSYFKTVMPKGRLPQIIFHGAEPMLTEDVMFEAIEKYSEDFRFGVQTNGTLLEQSSIDFLKRHGVGIGLSLDAPSPKFADRTRKTWNGLGVFDEVIEKMEMLKGYEGFNVICTVTNENITQLTKMVDFFHEMEVPAAMLNMLRLTLPRSRSLKPADHKAWKYFEQALDRTYELYKKTGRKLVVANFANILVGIIAPTARRLMCDISPCGGGRAFFSLMPNGDLFPCSEFVGIPKYKGGNLFSDKIEKVLKSDPFLKVSTRKVEDVDPCKACAIRNFCGSPCPAEAAEMNGSMKRTGAFCEFYEEQVRYAFRLIADKKSDDYLWDNWDSDTKVIFDANMI